MTASSCTIPSLPGRPSMSDSRHERMADVLVGFCASVQKGDLVTLESSTLAAPLLRELYRRVLEAGAQPL